MTMDFGMAFAILGIDQTNDENLIRGAYRTALPANNPEDKPEGFKSLRAAYEQALEYSRMAEADVPQSELSDAASPTGALVQRLDKIYKNISTRIDENTWRELLRDEAFSSLDDYEESKWALFSYLAQNYRVPREIYILLDEFFDIKENEAEFKERLPVGFVDFMTANISSPNSGYSLDWMRKLKGAEDADYDAFLNCLFEFGQALVSKDEVCAGNCVKAIDALGIWHPYYALDKARYLLSVEKKEAAADIVIALADAAEYREDARIQAIGGELLWRAGQKEKAYEILCRSLYLNSHNYIGNKYCAICEMEQGKLREALQHIYTIRNMADDAETRNAANQIERAFIARYGAQPADLLDPSDARLLAYTYIYQNEPDKAKEALLANASREREIKGYHMLLATAYRQKKDYDNAEREELLRLERIEEIIADLEAGRPCGSEDTLESLHASVSDANLQLGLIFMTRAKEAESPEDVYALYEKAALRLEAACKAFEGNYAAQLNLAHCCIDLHRCQRAYDIYEAVISQLGPQESLLSLKQRICYEIGNGQEVISLFYQLLNRGAAKAENYAYAARVFMECRQLNDAKNIFERADAENIESYGLCALRFIHEWLCAPEYNMELALVLDELLREGEADAKNPATADYLAELYYAKAMYVTQFQQKRAPHLRSAIEVHDRVKYRLALAQWCRENGELREAQEQYRYIEKYFLQEMPQGAERKDG